MLVSRDDKPTKIERGLSSQSFVVIYWIPRISLSMSPSRLKFLLTQIFVHGIRGHSYVFTYVDRKRFKLLDVSEM